MVRLKPKEITHKKKGVNYDQLMLEPGDGSVTKPSLLGKNTLDPTDASVASLFPIAYTVFLCQKHNQIPGDLTFQDNLLNILLTQKTTEDQLSESQN